MGSIYLDWLDDVVAEAAAETGYQWALFDGDWLHRARSSGGYDALPLCVMWHHTAGGDDAWGDARYQCYSADARPISNITVDSKIALVLAGGATNTNGSGANSPMTFSRGTVAKDDMNRRAVGIEICNNGVGAPYSEKQINFLFALSNKINAKCGNQPTDVCTHQHYAPDRKIDPSTAAAVQGAWKPRSVTSSGSWNVDDLRAECKRRWGGTSPTPPQPKPPEPTPVPPKEDWMANLPTIKKGDSGAYVKRMQHLLASAGYMNPANTANYDGKWGNGTDDAKKRFDNDHGLTPSPPTDCGDKSWESLMTGKKW